MTQLEDRIESIRQRLDLAFLQAYDDDGNMLCAISTPPKEVWEQMAVPPRYRYGYLPPINYEDPPTLVSYCPEVIAEQTLDFDDEELNFYLDNVEFQIFMHMSYLLDGDPEELEPVSDRQARVEDALHESHPDSLMVFLSMQADILSKL